VKLESVVQLKVLQSCSVYTTVRNMHTLVQFIFVMERNMIQSRGENHPYAGCVRMILSAELKPEVNFFLDLSHVQEFLQYFCGFHSARREFSCGCAFFGSAVFTRRAVISSAKRATHVCCGVLGSFFNCLQILHVFFLAVC